jgi:hypothetical protein
MRGRLLGFRTMIDPLPWGHVLAHSEAVDIMLALPNPDERPQRRLSSSVLVITVPIFVLALLAVVTGGSGSLGTPELSILTLIWVIGLMWVWWPWRRRRGV